MKHLLNRLINHETISKEEARNVLVNISEGKYNQLQIASFLTVFMMRSITIEELEGFRDALLDLCIAVDLSEYNPIDLCGTGGDGKDTFNISIGNSRHQYLFIGILLDLTLIPISFNPNPSVQPFTPIATKM